MNVSRIIEVTATLIIVYYVAVHADGFSRVINAIGSVYASSVKALQGR